MKTREEKQFGAVEFQRKRRKELSELYNSDQPKFWKRLEEIREKYRRKFRHKEKYLA